MARLRARLAAAAAFLTVAAASGLAAGPVGAVHESHHGPFLGTTSQSLSFFMRANSHTRVGIRVRWRATCTSGAVSRTTRFRNVAVGNRGRFFARNGRGVGLRGKIGFNAMGDPVFPEPFSFANNEAKGRVRAVVDVAGRGRCRSGVVTWDASR